MAVVGVAAALAVEIGVLGVGVAIASKHHICAHVSVIFSTSHAEAKGKDAVSAASGAATVLRGLNMFAIAVLGKLLAIVQVVRAALPDRRLIARTLTVINVAAVGTLFCNPRFIAEGVRT